MNMTDEEIAAGAFAILSINNYILALQKRKREARKRRWWVITLHRSRNQYDGRHLLSDLMQEPSGQFDNFCRMSSTDFEHLLQMIEPKIKKKDTFWREAIPAKVRLAVTLRFLATGDSFKSLHFLFKISSQVISLIVPEVCKAICEALKDYVKLPATTAEWLGVAKEFENTWQFPHCLGAMDGKHVNIQAPINSGSEYFNYKSSFSIILLGIADSDYNFLFADVGTHGRMSDGGVFHDSLLYHKFQEIDTLPQSTSLPGRNLPVPYVFVADAAFALSDRIMKPYPGVPPNGSQQRIFNQQLSRARVVIECTFGIMTSVFRVFQKPMLLESDKATLITLTCVILHNFLKKSRTSQNMYMPEGTVQRVLQENQTLLPLTNIPRRPTQSAKEIRDEFAAYCYSLRH